MKPKIYLHAGMHKTGTSAIQKWAKKNREVLEENNLFYPDYAPYAEMKINGHMQFTHAIAGKQSQLTFEECKKLAAKWRQDAEQKNCDIFFSAESIFRHFIKSYDTDPKTLYLETLKNTFSEFDVIPVLVFRRPDQFIESLYKEAVAKPISPLPELIDWAKTKFHLKYTENYLRYENVFGSVNVMTYEDLQRSPNFVQKFFSEMGFDIDANFDSERVRPSLSVPEIIVKNYANKYIDNRNVNDHFVAWLKANREYIESAFEGRHPSLWDSAQQKSRFLAEFSLQEFYSAVGITSDEKKFPPLKPDSRCFTNAPPEILINKVDQFFSECKVDSKV